MLAPLLTKFISIKIMDNIEINYATCLFCQKFIPEYAGIHQSVCAKLSDKVDDIICSIDEDTPDFHLYECDICNAIVSTDKMFYTHRDYCAEEKRILEEYLRKSASKGFALRPPSTSVDCNRDWCGINGYFFSSCSSPRC